MSYPYSPSRNPNIVNAGGGGSSNSTNNKNKVNNFYSTTVICGTCNNATKAYSRKHGRYICPFCDPGGEELLPKPLLLREQQPDKEQQKPFELPDIGVKYSTTDGHSNDKPQSSYHHSSTNNAGGRTKAVFKSANDRRGRRKPNGVNSEFDRVLKAQDDQLERSGNTITSDRIIRRDNHTIYYDDDKTTFAARRQKGEACSFLT
jgi:hypothetical protein